MTKYDTEPKTNHPLLQMDNDCFFCFVVLFYRFGFIKSLDLLFMFTCMWNLETQLEYLLCLITNNVF